MKSWKSMMNYLSEGIAVLGRKSEIYFYNDKIKQILLEEDMLTTEKEEDGDGIINKLSEDNLLQFDENLDIPEEYELQTINLDEKDLKIKQKRITFGLKEAVLILIQDVTEINKLVKIEAEDQYSTLLIATVTHELRTPTNAIANSITILRKNAPPNQSKVLDICEKSCKILLFLIDDIMVENCIWIYI